MQIRAKKVKRNEKAKQLECSKSADSQDDKEEVDVKKVLKVIVLKLLQTTTYKGQTTEAKKRNLV